MSSEQIFCLAKGASQLQQTPTLWYNRIEKILYVDDTLRLVRHERTYNEGCFGLHARGAIKVRNLRAARYIGPEGAPRDWEQRCKPRHLFGQQ